ncbi:MAG TPA: hypothetical protein VMU25_02550 [Candidatus Paceibacterota bacterium]|nr:hypothetical protein [Candidatus Paceibacterota bacterium]
MESHSRHIAFRWSAYEHEFIERDSDWFWALGIIAISGAIISVLFHDVLFALVILFAALAFGILATTAPQLATFEVSERGIRINGKLHRYHEIISFWVEDEHHEGRPLLLIDTVKFMAPNFVIPIENIDPHRLRMFLKKHVREVPMKEPIAHKIIEFVGL